MAKRSAAMLDSGRAKIRSCGQYTVRKHAHANSRVHATRQNTLLTEQWHTENPASGTNLSHTQTAMGERKRAAPVDRLDPTRRLGSHGCRNVF